MVAIAETTLIIVIFATDVLTFSFIPPQQPNIQFRTSTHMLSPGSNTFCLMNPPARPHQFLPRWKRPIPQINRFLPLIPRFGCLKQTFRRDIFSDELKRSNVMATRKTKFRNESNPQLTEPQSEYQRGNHECAHSNVVRSKLPANLHSYSRLSHLLDDLRILFCDPDKMQQLDPEIDGNSAAIAINHISRLRKLDKGPTGVHSRAIAMLAALAEGVVRDSESSPKSMALTLNAAASTADQRLTWVPASLCNRLVALLDKDAAAFSGQVLQ